MVGANAVTEFDDPRRAITATRNLMVFFSSLCNYILERVGVCCSCLIEKGRK